MKVKPIANCLLVISALNQNSLFSFASNKICPLSNIFSTCIDQGGKVFWKSRGLNNITDNENSESSAVVTDKITKIINSGMAGRIVR
jgi:hypothetical protein